jgi:ribose 5-phosphate isomerase A
MYTVSAFLSLKENTGRYNSTEAESMRDAGKQAAGRAAAMRVTNGMCVGLGSGSTAAYFIVALAERVQHEGLKIRGIAPSRSSEALAIEHGVPLIELTMETRPDLAVDGADEVDAHLALIKGGGGALVREKLVAASAKEFIIVADSSKSVEVLGAFSLPVAVIPFGWTTTQARLEIAFGVEALIRGGNATPYMTDDNLYILDMAFGKIPDPAETLRQLHSMVGVADAGLFVGLANRAIFGNSDGTIREQV